MKVWALYTGSPDDFRGWIGLFTTREAAETDLRLTMEEYLVEDGYERDELAAMSDEELRDLHAEEWGMNWYFRECEIQEA